MLQKHVHECIIKYAYSYKEEYLALILRTYIHYLSIASFEVKTRLETEKDLHKFMISESAAQRLLQVNATPQFYCGMLHVYIAKCGLSASNGQAHNLRI